METDLVEVTLSSLKILNMDNSNRKIHRFLFQNHENCKSLIIQTQNHENH